MDGVAAALAGLSGSDRVSVLLHAMSLAVEKVRPADLLRRHQDDRFVRPAALDLGDIRRVEDRLLGGLGPGVDLVALAPTVPFGTHRALGGTPQDNVVSTIRGSEVAADPTNGLALEAAVRRAASLAGDPKSPTRADLGTVQRVTRGQPFDDPMAYPHFSLVARVTAGRAEGNGDFEVTAVVDHLAGWRRGLVSCGLDEIVMTVTDFSGRAGHLLDRIADEVDVVVDPRRRRGRDYYAPICFQLDLVRGGRRLDVGDGGLVPWTAMLLSNAKERMVISALGVERVAHLAAGGD